jgi:hypothetical protein
MQTIMRISAVVLAVAGVASPAAGWAQDTGAQPVLEVGVRTMNAEGSRGRDAGVSRMLQPGQVATTLLHAGRIENPEGQLCSMRAADTTGRELNELDKRGLANALYVWKITMRGITAEPGRQTLDLEWQRFDRGSTAAAHSSKMRLTLADGQTHALELVHGAAAPPCNTRAVILELKASTREDPALADTVLRYDMWLVRHDKTGKKETRHLMLSGVQGAAPEFHFPPLATPVTTLQPDQYDFRVATRVSGAVRGRVTHDGRVSIELQTHRSDRVERLGSPSNVVPRSAGGRKVLTAALGEAIEIQLPPAAGSSNTFASAKSETEARERRERGVATGNPLAPPASGTAEPLLIRDGRLVVNYAAFFEGERVSVIVRVRIADAGGEEPPVR